MLEGDHSIETLLRVPKRLPLGTYEVHCEALIGVAGSAEEITCYSLPGAAAAPRKLVNAVSYAGRIARFAPATRDGEPAKVLMLLMVRVQMTKDDPLILVVPNNGVDAARYGPLYTAPQRFNEFYWDNTSRVANEITTQVLIWLKLQIDEQGKVTEFSVTNASEAPEAIVRNIEAQVGRMEFIPGFVDGKPAPMLYMEPAFRPRD